MINKIKSMKVEAKLKYCFTLVTLLASFSGILGIIIVLYSNIQYSKALVTNGFSQGEIGTFSTYMGKEPTLVRELIIISDKEQLKTIDNELTEAIEATDAAYETMKKNCTTAKEQNYLKEIEELLSQYRSIFGRARTFALNNQDDEALNVLVSEGKPKLKELTASVDALRNLKVEMGTRTSTTLTYTTIICTIIMVLVIIFAGIVSVKFASFVAKLFADPIIKVKDASAMLEQGNLDITIEKMYPDEIGEMTDSFVEATDMIKTYIHELIRQLNEIAEGNFNISSNVNFMGDFKILEHTLEVITDTLSSTMGNIHESSKMVSMGSSQLADSAQSLAEGATNQAASVEELSATIQNITETIVYSSQQAETSYHNAAEFRAEAQNSNEDIRHLNEAMVRINDTSKEIANIITSIEDIASQTNLLSLNASIEAARAGETGRGFAVVADQIGKLAADSTTSAANTRDLIEHAIREIENGNEIMQRTMQSIGTVINGIQTLAESTKEISALSTSQADAMKQLEIGVEQISEVIQNNSAAAQETSATSQELFAQSATLDESVKQFKLKM